MMTDEELDLWLRMLGKSKRQRVAVVSDLLRYANADGMVEEDRAICLRVLRRLGSSYTPCKLVRTTTPTAGSRKMFTEDIDDVETDAHISG